MDKIHKFDKLFEILDNKVDVLYKQKDNKLLGYFSIKNYNFLIRFKEYDNNIYTIKFYREVNNEWTLDLIDKINFDMLITSNVLNTINNEVINFIKNKQPDILLFSASDNSKGRKRLYLNFCSFIYQNIDNYIYTVEHKNNSNIFIIYKNNFDLSILDIDLKDKIYIEETSDDDD